MRTLFWGIIGFAPIVAGFIYILNLGTESFNYTTTTITTVSTIANLNAAGQTNEWISMGIAIPCIIWMIIIGAKKIK